MMTTIEAPQRTAFQALINDYADGDAWAHEQLIHWLKTKPLEVMDQEVASSFPTIKKTLLHIWKTQLFWLDVLQKQQRSYTDGDAEAYYEDDPDLSTLQVFDYLQPQSEAFTLFVRGLDEEALQEKVSVVTPWFESYQPRYELIQHCINHSTYHRGQLITMGRNLGMTDAPMTDFNFYLLQVK